MAEDDKTCLIEQVTFGEGMKYLPDTNLLKDPKGEQVIQYRKAKRFLKILTPELAMHTLQVDNCKTIAEIMDDICKKLQIPNNKESSLAFKDGHSQEKDEDLDKVFLIVLSFIFFFFSGRRKDQEADEDAAGKAKLAHRS